MSQREERMKRQERERENHLSPLGQVVLILLSLFLLSSYAKQRTSNMKSHF